MPKNKTQGIIFGIIMSYSMAVGMEIYNNAIQQGVHLQPGGFTNLTYGIVGKALVEALFMGLIVIIVSELWGNRLGARFAAKVSDPQRDNPYFCRLMRQAGTVSVMCPTMSLAATIIFSMILGGAPVWQLPAIWAGTLIKNFPMAFFWNMFAAAPFTNWACGKLLGIGKAPVGGLRDPARASVRSAARRPISSGWGRSSAQTRDSPA